MLIVAGPAAALPLFALWLVSRGRWMGLGDAKLALGIGFLLGLADGLGAIFLAFVIGAVISLGLLLVQYIQRKVGITRFGSGQRGLTMKSEVPFGPFLIASCLFLWLMMMYGMSVPFLTFI
jgi:prepilin signal peptidase PulO-like enzyme (type II secretory pathway)